MSGESGPPPEALQRDLAKTSYAKGFELLESFEGGIKDQMDAARAVNNQEEVSELQRQAEQVKTMRTALEQGNPRPLMEHLAMVLVNGMEGISRELQESGRIDMQHLQNLRTLFETLEELGKTN